VHSLKRFDNNSKVRTVKEVIKWLEQFPEDAFVYAYSGEGTGIVVTSRKASRGIHEEIGWLATAEALFEEATQNG